MVSRSRTRSRSGSRNRSRSRSPPRRSRERSPPRDRSRSPPRQGLVQGRADKTNLFSLRCNNLSYRTEANDIKRKFEKFGEIGDVFVPQDRDSGRSRGFCFVRYHNKDDMLDAVDAFKEGFEMDGRDVRVEVAADRPPPGSRSRDDRGGGYGGRGGDRGRDDRRGGGGYNDRRSPPRGGGGYNDRRRSPPRGGRGGYDRSPPRYRR